MKIQESAENYLETILILKHKNGAVRSIDIANELGFSKPSVSVAMKNLRENGYIEVDSSGYITLLDSGRQIAEKIKSLDATGIEFGIPSPRPMPNHPPVPMANSDLAT